MSRTGSGRPTVLVTVGSDHHPAHRLLRAVAEWAQRRPDVHVVAQRGPVAELAGLDGEQFMAKQDLVALMRDADVVVCTGGPATIAEVGSTRRRPVVVPRLARLGEVVDDHQVAYTRRMAASGDILLVEDVASLGDLLDGVLEDPARLDLVRTSAVVLDDAHRRFRAVVEEAAGSRRRTWPSVLLLSGRTGADAGLLEQLLDGSAAAVSVGRSAHLWDADGLADRGLRAQAGLEHADLAQAAADSREVMHPGSPLALLTGIHRSTWRLRRARLLARYRAAFSAAAAQAGASVVVDTSASRSLALLLLGARVPVRWVVLTGGSRWSVRDLALLALSRTPVPLQVVRQADLQHDPAHELERLLGGPMTSGVLAAHRSAAGRGTEQLIPVQPGGAAPAGRRHAAIPHPASPASPGRTPGEPEIPVPATDSALRQ